MSARPCRMAALLAVAAAAASAGWIAPTPAPAEQGAQGSARRCAALTVTTQASSYRVYALKARGVSCSTVRRIIRGVFAAKGTPIAPPSNSAGVRIEGWTAGAIDLTVWGVKGQPRFDGRYR